MDYTISPLLSANIVAERPELCLCRPSAEQKLRDLQSCQTCCGVSGLVFSTLLGGGLYFGLQKLGISKNRAIVTATVISLGPLLCTCCCVSCSLLAASAAKDKATQAANQWDTADAIVRGNQKFADTWRGRFDALDPSLLLNPHYLLIRGDAYKLVSHLDNWTASLNGDAELPQEQKEAAQRILNKMAMHAEQVLCGLEAIAEASRNNRNPPHLQHTRAAGDKLAFLSLETLLRTGSVQTIEITDLNAATELPFKGDVDETKDYRYPLIDWTDFNDRDPIIL